jgi:hypothetical protein
MCSLGRVHVTREAQYVTLMKAALKKDSVADACAGTWLVHDTAKSQAAEIEARASMPERNQHTRSKIERMSLQLVCGELKLYRSEWSMPPLAVLRQQVMRVNDASESVRGTGMYFAKASSHMQPSPSVRFLNGKEELELRWQLLLSVQLV